MPPESTRGLQMNRPVNTIRGASPTQRASVQRQFVAPGVNRPPPRANGTTGAISAVTAERRSPARRSLSCPGRPDTLSQTAGQAGSGALFADAGKAAAHRSGSARARPGRLPSTLPRRLLLAEVHNCILTGAPLVRDWTCSQSAAPED